VFTGQSVQISAADCEYLPAVHRTHVLEVIALTDVEYLPGSQFKHSLLEIDDENLPRGQSIHDFAAILEN
jgi:hypothetical protein